MPPPVLTMQSTSLRMLVLAVTTMERVDVGRALVLAEKADDLSQATARTGSGRARRMIAAQPNKQSIRVTRHLLMMLDV